MKNMTEFTEAQLEVMSKEKSPRGRKARMELERRKKMFSGEKVLSEKTEKSLDEAIQAANDFADSVNARTAAEKSEQGESKPKRTRRKPAAKKSEDNS